MAVKNKSKALKPVQSITAKQLDCRMWPHIFLGPALLLCLPCDLKKGLCVGLLSFTFCLSTYIVLTRTNPEVSKQGLACITAKQQQRTAKTA